jgi:surface protein
MTANDVLFGNTLYTDGEFACHVYGLDYSGNAETKVYRMNIDSLHVGTNKTANTVSKEVTFEYMGDTFTTTVTQGPYVENAIICTYNVTSTTSNTTLLYSSFSNYSTYFSSMIIDGEEMPIATSYKFSTVGEHSVLFKIAEGVNITNLYRMFYACSALKTVDLSELDMSLVTSTSNSAGTAYMFYNCSGLKSIILPESTKYLGYYMFYGCYNVEQFIIKAKIAPTLYGYNSFGYSSSYIGYNTRTYGTNKFQIPIEATGYDTTVWTNYLFNASYCGFKKSSPYIKQECTNLEITADDVKWKATTTLIN